MSGPSFVISRGLFNPALCRSLWHCALVGVVGPVRSLFIFIAQVVGSISAAAAVNGLLSNQADDVLFRVALGQGTSVRVCF
ncbi:Aquaporin-1 [Clarireedia jacksonii]